MYNNIYQNFQFLFHLVIPCIYLFYMFHCTRNMGKEESLFFLIYNSIAYNSKKDGSI